MTTDPATIRARFEGLSRNQRIAAVVLGLFLCRGCSLAVTPSEEDNRNATATAAADHQATVAAAGATGAASSRETAAARPTQTPRPEPTDRPPTATEVPPTETDEPTAKPQATFAPRPLLQAPVDTAVPAGPPTEVPAPHAELNPGANINCSDFPDRRDAQVWWDYWVARGVSNPGGLDGNNNGKVCER